MITCLLLLSALFASDAWPDPNPRVKIHIFKYSGTHNEEANIHFIEFKDILQAKVSLIAEELQFSDTPFPPLAELSPFFVTGLEGQHVAFSGSNLDLLQRWQRANALEIFLGRVRKVEQGYMVKSRVYLGELETPLESPFLSIELPILDKEYDTTRDSHSAVILFALAMDSRSRCRPRHETIALLSAAHEKMIDLSSELPGITELRSAIQSSLVEEKECAGDEL